MTKFFKPPCAATISLGLTLAAAAGPALAQEAADPADPTTAADAAAVAAAAQEAPQGETQRASQGASQVSSQGAAQAGAGGVFDNAYFAQYAPRTALDMIAQIPGFQLQGADNRRGLGQGGANVLINGERLTGKTDVGSQLSRIVSDTVERIEIRDGASLDIPGLSGQVANVVTRAGGMTGTWSWAPEFRERQRVNLNHVHLTVSGERGDLTYSAEVRNESQRNGDWGPETLTDAAGTVFEIRDEIGHYHFDGPGASLDLKWTPREGHVGNLNLDYNKQNFTNTQRSLRRAQDNPAGRARGDTLDTLFTGGEDEWNAKIGADYEFPLGSGTLKAIGYHRFERSPTRSAFSLFDLDGSRLGGSIFDQQADESESIVRSEYSWAPEAGRDWTLSVEGALNVLDIKAGLRVFDGTDFVSQAIDGATSRVDERRAEATLTHSRTLSPRWDVQASVGVEYSELEQTGGLAREFVRPKGFVLTTFKPDADTSWRLKLEREVGQLSFFDFIASVDVVDNIDRASNVNLVPPQSWFAGLEYDRNFGDGITLKLNPYVSLISDLVDRVPVGDDGDAVGNIDDALRYGVDFNSTIKGERWGWDGLQVDLELNWRDSRVDDPVTGERRRISRDLKTFWHGRFRHDVPDTQWAYGGGMREFADYPGFRLFTTDDPTLERPITYAFIEHKDVLGLKIRAEVINLLNSREEFTREIFTDRRDRGTLDVTEFQSRAFGPILSIEFSGTF